MIGTAELQAVFWQRNLQWLTADSISNHAHWLRSWLGSPAVNRSCCGRTAVGVCLGDTWRCSGTFYLCRSSGQPIGQHGGTGAAGETEL